MRDYMFERGMQVRRDEPHAWIGMLVGVIFWVALITLLIMLVRHLAMNGKGTDVTTKNSALDTLNDRYAKGEIDKKEYDSIKKDIA